MCLAPFRRVINCHFHSQPHITSGSQSMSITVKRLHKRTQSRKIDLSTEIHFLQQARVGRLHMVVLLLTLKHCGLR